MKTLFHFFLIAFISLPIYAQVGIGITNPNSSSILHLESTTSGLLIPRLTSVQKLLITSPATGLLIYQTDDSSGFWYYNGTIWTPFGGGSSYTFNNGLTEASGTAQLGGTLVKSTTLDLDDYDFSITTTSGSAFPGDFKIIGENRTVLETSLKEDYVHFGSSFPFLGTSVDGTTLTDISGNNYTIDVVAGFQTGSAIAGSSIKMGSVEYIMDGISELYFDTPGGVHPRTDQTTSFGNSLGNANKRWARVYANDGVIQTSDMRFKTNVKPLKYGLKEILKLNTITYNWKEEYIDDAKKSFIKEPKIGLSAQELLTIIPEVVSTHSIVPADEKGNYKRIKNNKLGVNYSEIIPIMIKAIQDQQELIQNQQKQIQELKEIVRK